MKHKVGDGLYAAAKTLFDGIPKVFTEFQRLNTRESRAAFADHWIGICAQHFDKGWPVIYELLKIIEEDELYKDSRRVGPGAPGFPKETHGQHSSYPDFAAYFTDRVKQPLARWAELERTYHYAQRYAPEIFELPYPEAATLANRKGGQPGNQNAKLGGMVCDDSNTNESCNTRIVSVGQNTNAAYIRARLERDSKREDLPAEKREQAETLLQRIEAKQISANAAAIEAGFRPRMIQHPATVEGFARAIRNHLNTTAIAELKQEI